MTFEALNSALSGLRVAQQQLNTISTNVANVGTEGYSRKILPQSTDAIAGRAIGVRSETIIRNVDLDLQRDLWTQISGVKAFDVQATYLNNIQKFHGPPDVEISLAAEIAQLRDDFIGIADNPDEGIRLQTTVSQAVVVANKFNDFEDLLTTQRNDAQEDIELSINTINDLLQQISDINRTVRSETALGGTTAQLEDERDLAVKQLAEQIGVSFFTRGDGVMVVQTINGVQLADENPTELFFDPGTITSSSSYPGTAIPGIFVGGDPSENPVAIDITESDLSGRLGGLVELRDTILPRYQAQIDELAHKTALRFEAQGLRLFVDATGNVPDDTPPDLTPLPAGTPVRPVEYVGFAGEIRVDESIVDDPSILRTGTYTSDIPITEGSNEVIRRIIDFAFGDVDYEQAVGTVNLNVLPGQDLQEHLGIYAQNNIVGGPNLTSFTDGIENGGAANELLINVDDFLLNYPADDSFQIEIFNRDGVASNTITIDLSDANANFPLGAATGFVPDGTVNNALEQIVAEINAQIAALGGAPDSNPAAGINIYGQFTFTSEGDVNISATGFANEMGDDAFNAIFGFEPQLFEAEDPYFDIQVGNGDPVRISIESGDTLAELQDKLELNVGGGELPNNNDGVPGLAVDDIVAGFLSIRPGDDFTDPSFGGDLTITGGPFTADGTGTNGTAADTSLIAALFGSDNPVSSVAWGSETEEVAGVGSGVNVSFRTQLLGPDATINTGLITSETLVDYSQKIIDAQTQDLVFIESRQADETTLKDLLEKQLLDESSVNIDEELANLILIQTAYSAAARAVTAADELFQELLNAVR